MREGDLVKIKPCGPLDRSNWDCACRWCSTRSTRLGLVLGPAPHGKWEVSFDCGSTLLSDHDELCGNVRVVSSAKK